MLWINLTRMMTSSDPFLLHPDGSALEGLAALGIGPQRFADQILDGPVGSLNGKGKAQEGPEWIFSHGNMPFETRKIRVPLQWEKEDASPVYGNSRQQVSDQTYKLQSSQRLNGAFPR